MAKPITDPDAQIIKTPAPPKRGKNAFPTFTPANTRVLRSHVKDTPFVRPNTEVKNTKIPPGVGLEQIPSPVNLKIIKKGRGRGRAGVVKKLDFDKLSEGLEGMELGKKGKKAGRDKDFSKGKGKEDETTEVNEELGQMDLGKKGRSKSKGNLKRKAKEAVEETTKGDDTAASRPTRFTRSKSNASKPAPLRTRKASATIAPLEPEIESEHFELNPIVPPSLKLSAAHLKRTGCPPQRSRSIVDSSSSSSASSSSERLNPAVDKTRDLLLSFRGKISSKLWKADEGDVEELKGAIGAAGDVSVLHGMLEVVEKFQAFRDCLDEFLEEVDVLGMG